MQKKDVSVEQGVDGVVRDHWPDMSEPLGFADDFRGDGPGDPPEAGPGRDRSSPWPGRPPWLTGEACQGLGRGQEGGIAHLAGLGEDLNA